MPHGTRSLRFLDTQISFSHEFKVEYGLMLEGFLRHIQKSSIRLQTLRLGPPGRNYDFFSPTYTSFRNPKCRPSFSVSSWKNFWTWTDIKYWLSCHMLSINPLNQELCQSELSFFLFSYFRAKLLKMSWNLFWLKLQNEVQSGCTLVASSSAPSQNNTPTVESRVTLSLMAAELCDSRGETLCRPGVR